MERLVPRRVPMFSYAHKRVHRVDVHGVPFVLVAESRGGPVTMIGAAPSFRAWKRAMLRAGADEYVGSEVTKGAAFHDVRWEGQGFQVDVTPDNVTMVATFDTETTRRLLEKLLGGPTAVEMRKVNAWLAPSSARGTGSRPRTRASVRRSRSRR